MSNIVIGIIAWWLAVGNGIVNDLKYWLMVKKIWYRYDQWGNLVSKRLKPLDCEICMGFWIGLSYSLYSGQSIFQSIVNGAMSSFFAILTSKLMNRI